MKRSLAGHAAAATCGAVAVCGAVAMLGLSANASGSPYLGARAAALVEASTGKRLYGLAPDRELPIASATKLMTALVTVERVRRLRTIFVQNDYHAASSDSQIGLVPGEPMRVRDLLIALLLPSADDAAEDLAFNVGGHSVHRFVAMMNARARELGLAHTHYSTPSGLDTPGNYSSASDLITLTRFLLAHHPFIARVVALRSAVLRTGNRVRAVSNRNDLLGAVPWIHGVKTGHTLGAGYVLVAAGRRDAMTLLSVVLGTASAAERDSGTLTLLRYGFTSFTLATPVRAGMVLARPTVRYRPGVHADGVAAATVVRVLPRGTKLAVKVHSSRQLAGPLRRGAVVGQVVVLANGRPIARTPLLLAHALPSVSPMTIAARFLTQPTTLLWLVVLLLVVSGLALVRRGRVRGSDSAGLNAA